jgi:hypothetical protein
MSESMSTGPSRGIDRRRFLTVTAAAGLAGTAVVLDPVPFASAAPSGVAGGLPGAAAGSAGGSARGCLRRLLRRWPPRTPRPAGGRRAEVVSRWRPLWPSHGPST